MDEISEMASGILNTFPPEKMHQLITDFHRLIDIWNISSEEEEDLQANSSERLDRLRLIHTAYSLSKIATNHATALRRISERYPNFWKFCEDINESDTR